MTLVREVKFEAAYDKTNPDPKKNYGVHGLHIWFILKNPEKKQALTFSVSTNWQLPHVKLQHEAQGYRPDPMAFGVDIHREAPEGRHCAFLGCGCESDGSALLGEEFLTTLIAEGDEGLWKRMEEQLEAWGS